MQKGRGGSSFSSKPKGNRETIRESGVPDVCAPLAAGRSRVARNETKVIAQVVIETGVEPVGPDLRYSVAAAIVGKYLGHAADKLRFLDQGRQRKALEPICSLDPIPAA